MIRRPGINRGAKKKLKRPMTYIDSLLIEVFLTPLVYRLPPRAHCLSCSDDLDPGSNRSFQISVCQGIAYHGSPQYPVPELWEPNVSVFVSLNIGKYVHEEPSHKTNHWMSLYVTVCLCVSLTVSHCLLSTVTVFHYPSLPW